MNRIYRLVWNAALSLWVAVAENSKGRSKGGSARSSVDCSSVHQGDGGHGGDGGSSGFTLQVQCRAALVLIVSSALFSTQAHAADAANASVVAGSGSVATAGNVTTINQATQKLAIDWTSLSTRANEALVFNQPNASAIALNRIIGSSPSEMLGSLTANGQVFILNPNGVLFGAGSQVNVGGLVASTMNLSNADFEAGNFRFSGSGTGSVINQGTMTAAQGGYLALLAPEVRNEGVMVASLGTALLAAGNKVTLNLDNGSLLGYSIDQGAINALAENKQLIQADGGQVLLSARAMDSLTTATVNNSGIIEAKTLQSKAGRILLMGDMEVGTVNVGGTLDASAPTGGDGGFIETSAAHVKVASGTRVTTQSATGQTGKWLVDPNDFTISASGGDMDAATVAGNLSTTNFEIQTASMGTAGNGDIFVNEDLSWSSANTLTLTAQRNIALNNAITTTSGGLTINAAGNISAPGAVNVGTFTLSNGVWSQIGSLPGFSATDFRISGGTFIRALGGNGASAATAYQLGDIYGLQGAGSAGMLGKRYVLANDIDASGTAFWNSDGAATPVYAGFKPIGNNIGKFSGSLNGQDYTISSLTINRPTEDYVGLFGWLGSGSTVSKLGLAGGSVTGGNNVGGLAGFSSDSAISNSYVSIDVSGGEYVGGLVGYGSGSSTANSTISNSYASGDVHGNEYVGGLAGYSAKIALSNSYASGDVNGSAYVGGLVGYNFSSIISNSYAAGAATGTSYVGALVGVNSGTVTASFWQGAATSGFGTNSATINGGTRGLSTAEFSSAATFTDAGWNASNVGGDGSIWRIYEGNTGPLLRRFLTGLTVADTSVTYNGNTQASATTSTPGVSGSNVSARNAGSYATGYYSGQEGYDIIGGALTIAKASLTLAAVADTKTYDGTAASTAAVSNSGLIGGDTVTAAQSFGSKNVMGAGGSTLSVDAGYTLNDGNNGGNYNVITTTAAGTINKASLTLAAVTDSKTYDGTTASSVAASNTGLVGGDTVTAAQSFGSKNVMGASGSTLSVDAGYTLNDGNSGGNYNVTTTTAAGTINKASLTLAAVTDTKTYDGTAASTAAVSKTGLMGSDTVTAAQSFGSKNVMGAGGSTLSVDAGYTLNDGNSGGNYNVTTTTAAGTINKASLTLAAVTDSKTYDGTRDSGVAVNVTGLFGSDSVTADQSFGSKNVMGSGGSTLSVDAGYTVSDGNGGGNYNITTTTAAGTINKASLTLAAVTDSKTYDGTRDSAVSVNVTGLFGSDSVTADQSFVSKNVLGTNGSTLSVDAGYTVSDGNSGGNYNVTTTTAAGTINKASLTLAAVTDTKTYDGTAASTAAVSKTGLMGSDTVTAAQSFDSKNVMGAGGSTLSVDAGYTLNDGNSGGNYNVTTTTAAGTINKASLTLAAVTDTKTYDGTAASTTAVSKTGLVGSDTVTAAQSFGSKNVMGSGGSTLSVDTGYTLNDGNSGGNYNVTTTTAAGTINKASLTLAAVTDSKTYDGTRDSGVAVNVTGLFGSDSVTADQSFGSKNVMGSGGSTLSVDAGYTVSDGNSGGNYNVTTTTAAGTINKASLTLAAVTDTKTYDATAASSGAVNNTGLVGGDTVTAAQSFGSKNVMGAGGSTLSVDAGYTVSDGNSGGNYNVTTTTAAGTINKASLTLAAVTDTKTYDGTAASTAAVSNSGLIGGDTVTAAQSFGSKNVMGAGGSTLSVDAGYTLNDGNNGGNYNVITTTAAGTINKASLTLAAVTDSKTYDGTTASSVAVSNTGLVGGDTVTAAQSFGSKNVLGTGGSTLSVDAGYTLNDGNSGGNYNVITTTAAGTINKASLTLAAVTDTKTYDGTAASSVAVSNTGLVGGDTVTAAQSFGSKNVLGTNGSTLSVDAGYTLNDGNSGGNYNVITTTAAGTINKASLTLAAVTDSKTYDGTTASSVAVSNTGLVGVDTVAAAQSFGSKNVMGSNGSTLSVDAGYTVADGNGGGNYNVTTTAAAGTINKATLNISATPDDKVYDGTTAATASYTDNRISGDVLTYTATASFATKDAGTGIAVTVGGVITSGTDAGNYVVGATTAGNTADITPKTLTVTANDDSRLTGTPYTGGNGVTYSGLVAGETTATVLTGNVAYGGDSQGANLAGEYDITPGGLTANSNYMLNFMEGTLTLKAGDAASAALGSPALVSSYNTVLNAVAGLGGGGGGGGSNGGGGSSGGSSGGGGGVFSNSPNAAGAALNAAASDSGSDGGDK